MVRILALCASIPGIILIAACTMGHATGTANMPVIGYVEMASDGALLVTYSPRNGHTIPPFVVRPEQKAYAGYVEQVDGIIPGERKPMYQYAGRVRMEGNRVLTVSWSGGYSAGGLIVEPATQTIRPGEPSYDNIIARVGGLVPNQTKGIPPEPSTQIH